MIDGLYLRLTRLKRTEPNPHYRPEDAIIDSRVVNRGADKLAVVFPGWHTHGFPASILTKRLARKNWSVLAYNFHDQVLVSDENEVEKSFIYIRDTIVKDIRRLERANNYKQVHFIGISLGNVPLALVADKHPDFSSATLVLAGDNLAVDMWHGTRTSDLQKSFRKIHISLSRLNVDWAELAPINHIKHFRGKPVKVVMSLRDKFIQTKYQELLVKNLSQTNADLEVQKSPFGHVMTIILFCLFDSPL